MATWLTLELHALGGFTVKSEISEEDAAGMLRDQHRYIFPSADLDDREKVVQMTMTQVGLALDKQSGIFVTADTDGRTWLIPNAHIMAATVAEPGREPTSIGFHQLDAAILKPEDPSVPDSAEDA